MTSKQVGRSRSVGKSSKRSAIPTGFILPKRADAAPRSQARAATFTSRELAGRRTSVAAVRPGLRGRRWKSPTRSWTIYRDTLADAGKMIERRHGSSRMADLRSGHRDPQPATASLRRSAGLARRRLAALGARTSASTNGTTSRAELPELAAPMRSALRDEPSRSSMATSASRFWHDRTFLRKNGVRFRVPIRRTPPQSFSSLAAGEVSEESLARWIRDNWPKA